jgi:hypothetical protein
MDNLLDSLIIDDSFDKHYKLIQSLRNQYLSMIRMVLKNKRLNNLTLEEIMGYHDIENKIIELRKDISIMINNKYINLTQPDNNDIKMFRTLQAFLPLMILYYNSINTQNEKNINEKNINEKNINEKNINEKNINEKNVNDSVSYDKLNLNTLDIPID